MYNINFSTFSKNNNLYRGYNIDVDDNTFIFFISDGIDFIGKSTYSFSIDNCYGSYVGYLKYNNETENIDTDCIELRDKKDIILKIIKYLESSCPCLFKSPSRCRTRLKPANINDRERILGCNTDPSCSLTVSKQFSTHGFSIAFKNHKNLETNHIITRTMHCDEGDVTDACITFHPYWFARDNLNREYYDDTFLDVMRRNFYLTHVYGVSCKKSSILSPTHVLKVMSLNALTNKKIKRFSSSLFKDYNNETPPNILEYSMGEFINTHLETISVNCYVKIDDFPIDRIESGKLSRKLKLFRT